MYYVAHRLFAAHDRHLGAIMAAVIAEEVGEAQVFLPFCDTDEENLRADVKGRRLYDLDRARLDHIDGMLALLHGPSLDDGVCMELGYAAQRGTRVVILTTDFQTYGRTEHGPALTFPDPLIEAVASSIIRVPYLGPPVSSRNRLAAFAERNQRQVTQAVQQAVDALLTGRAARPAPPLTGPASSAWTGTFYEPNPYLPHTGAAAAATLGEPPSHLLAATRHTTAAADPLAAAHADWAALQGAATLAVDVRGPETPCGAALMIGASRAAVRRIIALTSPHGWTFADGREPNYRNLMIQYAVDERRVVAADEPAGS